MGRILPGTRTQMKRETAQQGWCHKECDQQNNLMHKTFIIQSIIKLYRVDKELLIYFQIVELI